MDILQLLSTLDPIEIHQKKTKQFLTEFPDNENATNFRLPSHLFFKHKSVSLSKHHRFAKYPTHSHEFVEINYIFSGTVTEIINGERVILKKKDFILIPPKIAHEILPLSEKDIMINLMFPLHSFSAQDVSYMINDSSITLDLFIKRNATKPVHLNDTKISQYIESIATEYFLPEKFSNEMIHHYVSLLFFQLFRLLHDNLLPEIKEQILTTVLHTIEENFASITLQDLSQKTGYSYSYTSNLIKKELHSTFSEIVLNQKLLHAADLLRNTNLPIDSIIMQVGLNNKTYFYKKFKSYYDTTPKAYRKMADYKN